MASTSNKSSASGVWKHFIVEEANEARAICTICKKSFSRGGKQEKSFNTTNLRKHLKSSHADEYDCLTKEEELKKEEQQKMNEKRKLDKFFQKQPKKPCTPQEIKHAGTQMTIRETIARKQPWDINSDQSQEIHAAIGEMIASDCQPISVVEDIGFSRLMQKVKPNYVLPSRKYFSEKVLPEIHRKVRNKVNKIVEDSENISFTSDIWTNNSNHSFISLTAHCINKNFERKILVLRVAPFAGSHTSCRISEVIESVITEFEIPTYKVHVLLRDNGANMVKGIADTGYSGLACFLHTLQLVIHDVLFEQRVVKDMITNCKKIVGHFSHSSLACSKLSTLQKQHELPEHKLVQDVSTRWNSTYFMLDRLCEQKKAVASYCVDTANMPVLDANKWNLIAKLTRLLKVFHNTTVRLSDRSSAASEIIPQIKFLELFVEKALESTR